MQAHEISLLSAVGVSPLHVVMLVLLSASCGEFKANFKIQ